MSKDIIKTPWGSLYTGSLSKGCQQCILGEKLVVLVTAKCTSKCFYCPISIERKVSPYAFANERPIIDSSDLILEANIMKAKGASMTGGDPMEDHSFFQTLKFCQILRKEYHKDFHIHIYTRGKDLGIDKLEEITHYINEIRFHVINLKKDFTQIENAINFNIDIGIEVPTIPTMGFDHYRKLIKRFEELLPPSERFFFINLNELEISETNYRNLLAHDLKCDHKKLSAVKGSEKLAKKIVIWASKQSEIPIHFCSLSTKDSVQLSNRLYRTAKNIKLPSDVIIPNGSDKGLLLRGVIKSPTIDLNYLRNSLIKRFSIQEHLISIDYEKNRLLTNAALLDELKDDIRLLFPDVILAMVEEYPTYDNLQTTFIPL